MDLRVSNVSKYFGRYQALADISFQIIPGQIVGLLGRNGAGKTTLLKALAGLIRIAEGEIIFDKDLSCRSKSYRQSIGYMSEKNPLYDGMYVKEYLDIRARQYGLDNTKGRTLEMIEKCGLEMVVNHRIKHLSKGYRQRLGMAAALLHNPDLLLLDEPVNGLDPAQILEYRSLIKSFSSGKVVIISSHLLQEVDALCDRVMVIQDGRLVRDQLIGVSSGKERVKRFRLVLDKHAGPKFIKSLESVAEVRSKGQGIYDISAIVDPRYFLFDLVVKEKRKIMELRELTNELDTIFKEV